MKHLLIGVAALALASCGNNLNEPITSAEAAQQQIYPASVPVTEYADSNTRELYPDVIGLSYTDARDVMQAAGWNPRDLGLPTVMCEECITTVELNECDDSAIQRCTWIYDHIGGKETIVLSTTGSMELNDLEVAYVDYLDEMQSTFEIKTPTE